VQFCWQVKHLYFFHVSLEKRQHSWKSEAKLDFSQDGCFHLKDFSGIVSVSSILNQFVEGGRVNFFVTGCDFHCSNSYKLKIFSVESTFDKIPVHDVNCDVNGLRDKTATPTYCQ
jgi:hypothetical protein